MANVGEDVAAELGLDEAEASPVLGGRISKVWRATRGGRPVAVRQSPWFRTLDEVAYECAVLAALARAGAPVVPAVAGPVHVAGSVWTAFAWADGTHPARPVHDPARYGRLLAELHQRAAALTDDRPQRPGWGRMDEFLTQPRGELTLQAVLADFERATGEVGRRLGRTAREVHERLAAAGIGVLPKVVAHGDFGPHQVLLHDDESVSAVLDWDFTHIDVAITDLAIATSLARPTAPRAAEMLVAYLRASELELGDPSLLGDLRRAFHLNNLANQVCALWTRGVEIDGPLAVITERLDREDWWDPTLREALRLARDHPDPGPQRPLTPRTLSDLGVAWELADRAAIVARHYFTTGVVTESKADASPVSAADRAVERLLREGLAELRPDDAVLGEELGRQGQGPRTWILDPIDGTAAFARADPNWRIQIALQEEGAITVAVVDAPALGIRWWAAAGEGAHETSADTTRRLHTSTTEAVEEARVAVHPRAASGRLGAAPTVVQPTPLPLIELVRGEIDAFYVDCCQLWDHAPWILLVEEAGGAFTDHQGTRDGDKRGGLYSNGKVHDALLAGLRPPIDRIG